MGRISKLEINESANDLRRNLKLQKLNKNRDRIQSLIHLKENTFGSRELLSLHLGISLRTLERWINLYMKGGLATLLLPEKRNRKSYLIPDKVDAALAQKVNNREVGFASYVEAQQWVASKFGLELKYNTIREHLIRYYNTKIKSPRKSHVKKDEKAVEAFLKTT